MKNLLPNNIKQWLNDRLISDEIIDQYELSWNGTHLVIPVHDIKGNILFNKYRRDPFSQEGPKYKYEKGATSKLYGLKTFNLETIKEKGLVICEGELDCLCLLSFGIPAITSTGGASTFEQGWADYLNKQNLQNIYICLDSDDAGMKGAFKIYGMINMAKMIEIPKEYKDVTEYLLKSGKTFTSLMLTSKTYILPDGSWRNEKTKNGLKEIKQAYEGCIGALMNEARNERAAYLSDRYTQYAINLYMTRLDEVKRAIKYFSNNRSNFDGNKIALAKQVPITNFIEFNSQGDANCLWHSERTPSMHYYEKQNRVKCFGCDQLGDVIDVVQKLHSCNLPSAIKIILNEK